MRNDTLAKIIVATMFLAPALASASSVFPEPSCLKTSVDFWERVYTTWGRDTMVVHDSETFKVYSVTSVPPAEDKKRRRRAVDEAVAQARSLLPAEEKARVRAQNGIKERFAEGVRLAKKHDERVREALRASGVPAELALLPHVESSFQPNARSKVGARGVWQVMPATLRTYFGRKAKASRLSDVEFATTVAIEVLKDNYSQLSSWPLAVKAYHTGLGRIKKAVKQTGTTDVCVITSTFEDRAYKFASRNYYSQLLATIRILEKNDEHDKHGPRND